MKVFQKLLGVSLLVSTTNNFVWFALTFWIYLQTKSVISTSTLSGIWLVFTAVVSIWFGSLVDHHKKRTVMMWSSVITLAFFITGLTLLYLVGPENLTSVANPYLWILTLILMGGVIAGNIYQIAIPTLVPSLVEKNMRDRANGMFGTVMGISFAITSVASGFVLAYGGMLTVLALATGLTVLPIIVLLLTTIKEKQSRHDESVHDKKIDVKGTIKAIKAVPGLFALIFFTTFNNFLGGVFMALMDAYGLSLVSVQNWGLLLGVLSFGFIIGGAYISKKGLGNSPLATLFRVNIVLWIVCIFFTIQPSIILLSVGFLIWMSLVPFIEATEQTIFQQVVPPERLGRVFGFAHAVEQAASPITSFVIGPIAQFVFIPFMTTGAGVQLIGNWFGVGTGRGIALVFITAGIIGLLTTLIARRSHGFYLLAKRYKE
jgi:MFS transporter, DHA3 family, multidrug efflux protein